ncbi:NAD(P)-binding protein [Paenarthrobacter sp. NPDC058040]|uniref:oxidoreductase n=1 Tax=unclassified Paenarthrobacter TaxID=2634190 RepID=UPI0036D82D00
MTSWMIDEPIVIGPHELRGRIYLPAHQPGLADGGKPGERYIAYHRERARSGVAMQVTGATPIVPSSEWSDICLWNIDDSIIPGYRKLAAAVRAEGGRMLAQLAHPGPTETEGPGVIGPSRDLSEVSRQVAVPATEAQLAEIVEQYAAAADRCRRGQLDGVEISMAHGLLLASFISPLTNHRTDRFGGDLEGRLTFPIQVLDAVREAIGTEMILGIRLGVDDLVEGGLRPPEAAQVAKALESRVDYISVMVGNNNRMEARVRHWPPTPAKPGLFRDVARTIKEAVTVPVCAVGRIMTAELANDLVVSGDADMVGMVRAQIADPELLAKTRAGRRADIRPCVGANVCVNELLAARKLTCLVNPDVGTVHEVMDRAATNGKRAVVVGAGPGGLESARRLALAGYRVTLFEKAGAIGGQMAAWSNAPSRQEFKRYLDWQSGQLEGLGVDLQLSTEATADDVVALSPAITVVATGAVETKTSLKTDGSIQVLSVFDALNQGFSGSVVVFDAIGNLDGAFIAERLTDAGAQVTLATSRLHVGEGEGINTLYPMLRTLSDRGIHTVERVRLSRIQDGSLYLEGVFGQREKELRPDAVVAWFGGDPVTGLAEELRAKYGMEPVVIGDALRPRRALQATQEAKDLVDAQIRFPDKMVAVQETLRPESPALEVALQSGKA